MKEYKIIFLLKEYRSAVIEASSIRNYQYFKTRNFVAFLKIFKKNVPRRIKFENSGSQNIIRHDIETLTTELNLKTKAWRRYATLVWEYKTKSKLLFKVNVTFRKGKFFVKKENYLSYKMPKNYRKNLFADFIYTLELLNITNTF